MSYKEHVDTNIAKQVRNKEFAFRFLILVIFGLFSANLYVNSYTLVKVNSAVEVVQDCVEVEGKCYQDRINSSQSSTSTIITAMAAVIDCNTKADSAGIPRKFEDIRSCVFSTIDMLPVQENRK